MLANKKLGTAPGTITLDRSDDAVELVLRHAGYTPLKQSIVPDHDQELHLTMHHAPKTTTSTSNSGSSSTTTVPDPHGTENPFKH